MTKFAFQRQWFARWDLSSALPLRRLHSTLTLTPPPWGGPLPVWPPRQHVSALLSRSLHTTPFRQEAEPALSSSSPLSNPPMSFPCLDALESKSASLRKDLSLVSGPEPEYTAGRHDKFRSDAPLLLDWGGVLPRFELAYETWGTLRADRSNAILLHTGLSASSHARSTPANDKPGWWEKFIGPGGDRFPLDLDRYFVICTNVLGGCYGSTGPGSADPADGRPYGTRFPVLTLQDMVRAQFRLLDHLGIERLYASIGASMGGMQSLAAAVMFPERVGRVVSISGCARSHPYSIAMRHTQRQVLMMDPNWRRGFYYDHIPPHAGMKLAREIATITYRSGPEWEQRFGRRRADPSRPPALCPDFLIETYLDHAGEKFSLDFDANSLLYISKAMDLFDLGAENQRQTAERRQRRMQELAAAAAAAKTGTAATAASTTTATLTSTSAQPDGSEDTSQSPGLMLPDVPYQEQESSVVDAQNPLASASSSPSSASALSFGNDPPADLVEGLAPMRHHPTLVMGVASDILFPAWQQREIAETLRRVGNERVSHIELGEDVSLFGHDTFLLDLEHIGSNLKRFLSA